MNLETQAQRFAQPVDLGDAALIGYDDLAIEHHGFFPRLAERRKQFAATLSGGELQMLCIGRGLMSQPKMMLLDEPSAALAPQVVLDIFRTIGRICRDGMTLLLVEQNVRMALLLAEHAYVLRDGIVHMEGSAEALIHDDAVRLSYLGGTVAADGVPSL